MALSLPEVRFSQPVVSRPRALPTPDRRCAAAGMGREQNSKWNRPGHRYVAGPFFDSKNCGGAMHKECEKIGVTAMHDATECSVWGGAAFDTATSQGA